GKRASNEEELGHQIKNTFIFFLSFCNRSLKKSSSNRRGGKNKYKGTLTLHLTVMLGQVSLFPLNFQTQTSSSPSNPYYFTTMTDAKTLGVEMGRIRSLLISILISMQMGMRKLLSSVKISSDMCLPIDSISCF
ncbi:hypothetical protein GIB67_025943, partial [Kingdonia uniflora]